MDELQRRELCIGRKAYADKYEVAHMVDSIVDRYRSEHIPREEDSPYLELPRFSHTEIKVCMAIIERYRGLIYEDEQWSPGEKFGSLYSMTVINRVYRDLWADFDRHENKRMEKERMDRIEAIRINGGIH